MVVGAYDAVQESTQAPGGGLPAKVSDHHTTQASGFHSVDRDTATKSTFGLSFQKRQQGKEGVISNSAGGVGINIKHQF